MQRDQLTRLFDQQANTYDAQWDRIAPVRDALFLLMDTLFAPLPAEASILCVGAGTGVEALHLASNAPAWRFTLVEPSGPMLERAREHASNAGVSDRFTFHQGFLDELPARSTHHAATCLLVSQFIVDPTARAEFFSQIASHLRPGGLLLSSDLAADHSHPTHLDTLLPLWLTLLSGKSPSPEHLSRARHAYTHDVAVIEPSHIARIIQEGGFQSSTLIYQAGMLHAWLSQKP